jgi:hypothetical protein
VHPSSRNTANKSRQWSLNGSLTYRQHETRATPYMDAIYTCYRPKRACNMLDDDRNKQTIHQTGGPSCNTENHIPSRVVHNYTIHASPQQHPAQTCGRSTRLCRGQTDMQSTRLLDTRPPIPFITQ